jgi:hypothetical protein
MNSTVKKKVNFIHSTQNEGLSPSCIALSFDGFGSISWHSIWVLSALSYFFSGFPTFRHEHHWRDFISRNVHLVHQNWYRISFTLWSVFTNPYRLPILCSVFTNLYRLPILCSVFTNSYRLPILCSVFTNPYILPILCSVFTNPHRLPILCSVFTNLYKLPILCSVFTNPYWLPIICSVFTNPHRLPILCSVFNQSIQTVYIM